MDVLNHWPEMMSGVLIVFSLLFVLTSIRSFFMCLLLVFFWGLIFGRLFYKMKKNSLLKYSFFSIAFIIGYVFGSTILGYYYPVLIISLYLLGIGVSYYVHKEKFIKSV